MAKQVSMGARGEAAETVEFKHTLTAHHPQLPPVCSTPAVSGVAEASVGHAPAMKADCRYACPHMMAVSAAARSLPAAESYGSPNAINSAPRFAYPSPRGR